MVIYSESFPPIFFLTLPFKLFLLEEAKVFVEVSVRGKG